MPNRFISGKNIYLGALEGTQEEIRNYVRWFADGDVTRTLASRFPINEARERDWFARLYQDRSDILFGIYLKRTDRHIGGCGLHRADYVNRNAEAGIVIGEKKLWGRGYGTEAMALLLDYGFEYLNLHRIMLRVYAFNKRGFASYTKLGFTKEGALREDVWRDGAYHDTILMGIMRREWQKKRKI